MDNLMKKMQEAAMFITSRIGQIPVDIGMVLGSGLGDLADDLANSIAISYKDIPHFPVSTVFGHKGRLVAGDLEGNGALYAGALPLPRGVWDGSGGLSDPGDASPRHQAPAETTPPAG